MPQHDYDRVRELFRAAESRIKQIEQLDGEIVFPAINELRYVGYHVLESLPLEGEDRRREIFSAEEHAARAGYDVLEAGILERLLEFEQFKADFRLISIGDVVPDYLDLCQAAEDARDTLAELENRNHSDMHPQLQEHFETLSTIMKRLTAAREELNKKARRLNLWVFYSILGTVITVVAIVVPLVVSK